jgi:spore maturation protein CgeB
VKAVNPRTFEILGSGGLLLTDRRLDDIEGFEEGEGYIHYSNEAELLLMLRDALEDEQKAAYIADIGHSEARAHTFEHRARRILGDLG